MRKQVVVRHSTIHTEIASNATPCSRPCLALSSKRLFYVISDGFSVVFDHLKHPEEAPSSIVAKDWRQVYQPERWDFLCLLQKDPRQWLACPDCLVLHPVQWFGQTSLPCGLYGRAALSVGLQSLAICLAIRFREDLWTFAHASKSHPARSALCLPIFIDESKSRKTWARGVSGHA